jgi:chemotaxis protein MotB
MKKKQKPKKENGERWLLTYSDLITLLMILFILLYSMSSVNEVKYEQLSQSLKDSLGSGAGFLTGTDSVLPGEGTSVVDLGNGTSNNVTPQNTVAPTQLTDTPKATDTTEDNSVTQGAGQVSGGIDNQQDMQNFENDITNILKQMDSGVSASTTLTESGLTITFANDVFFDSGQDTLKAGMKQGLKELAKLLNRIDNSIIIEGHTDNVPINSSTSKFASNWQLSAARAANVAQFLVDKEKMDGTRIAAIGYGEFRPVVSNNTNAGKSKNRRVDIIILYNNQAGLQYNY